MAAASHTTCLMCLKDGGKMKIAGPCDHAFCTECLENHLGKQAQGVKVYPCPTCKQDCPLLAGGVDGLADAEAESGAATAEKGLGEKKTQKPTTGDECCRICKFKGKDARAINRCPRCNDLDLCEGCSEAHKTSSATRSHDLIRLILIRLPLERGLSKSCSIHKEPFISYCHNCGEPVCSLCIVLEHDSHEVLQAGELIDTTTKRVNSVKGKVEARLKELQTLQSEMKAARDHYCLLRDTTIVDIEMKANECIEKIQQQKEQLIAAVRAACKVDDTEANLARLPGVIDDMASALKATEQVEEQFKQYDKETLNESLLMKPVQRPSYIESLETVDAQLKAALCVDDIDRDGHRELPQHPPPTFTPQEEQDLDIGKLEQPPIDDWKLVQTWKKTDGTIKNVAIFGTNSYALALAPEENAIANTIKFCHFNSLKQPNTIRQASHDIEATPSGSLAVLCDGKTKGNVAVKLFNADGDHLESVCEVGLNGPLSMSVTMYGEYVILSRLNYKECCITAIRVQKVGKVFRTSTCTQSVANVSDYMDISCGGRYTFLSGKERYLTYSNINPIYKTRPMVEMYEVGKGNITLVDTKLFTEYSNGHTFSGSLPITATLSDDTYCCVETCSTKNTSRIHKLVKMSDKGSMDDKVSFQDGKIQGNSRMHIRGNLALVSEGASHAFFRLTEE